MTGHEFNDWFAYHSARFTGLGEWLAKKTDLSGQPMAQAILGAWAGLLRDVSLEDAKKASDQLFSKPESEQPRSYDRHPAAIREAARMLRRQRGDSVRCAHYVDGEQVYDCRYCEDTGAVICWHQNTVKALREGHLEKMLADPRKHPAYTCPVRCHCTAGEHKRWMGDAADPRKLPRLDEIPTLEDLAEWVGL